MPRKRAVSSDEETDPSYLTPKQAAERRRSLEKRKEQNTPTASTSRRRKRQEPRRAAEQEISHDRQENTQNPEYETNREDSEVNTDEDMENDSDDPDYETERERNARQRKKRTQQSYTEIIERRQQQVFNSDSDNENDDIFDPIILIGDAVCKLGDANHKYDCRCPYCGALHFKTRTKKKNKNYVDLKDLICCDGGKVMVPPMMKRPDEIENLTKSRSTRENIVSYNTAFSFASIQYHHVPAAPFGLPVAKTLGPIRHFTSAALPANPNNPRFGALYLYMGDQAVQLRMEGFSHLDENIVAMLQKVFEKCHPFAETLRTMGDIIKEEMKAGEDEDLVRLRIVDAKLVPKEMLRGNHKGLYRRPVQCGDFVALFYSATIEQEVSLPGLLIYPRRNNKTPLPMLPGDSRINCLCYPILFPYGEAGWMIHGLKLTKPEVQTMTYEQRLIKWGESNPMMCRNWDLNHSLEELRKHQNDPTTQIIFNEEVDEPNDEDKEDDDIDDSLLHELQSYRVTGVQTRRRFVERAGDIYPRPAAQSNNEKDENYEDPLNIADNQDLFRGLLQETRPSRRPWRTNLTGDIDDEDLTPAEIENDLQENLRPEEYPIQPLDNLQIRQRRHGHDENETSNEDDNNADDIGDQTEEMTADELDAQRREYVSLRQWMNYQYQRRTSLASDVNCVPNRFTSAGKLGQVFLLDNATRMYQIRHSFQRAHHTEFMSTDKTKMLAAVQKRADKHNMTIGCISTVPNTVPGSPRHLQKLYDHTVAMSRMRHGKPDLFITVTCNVNWPEIKENIPPGETWADNPHLVNEVFKKKLELLMDMIVGERYEKGHALRKRGIFGRVRWWSSSIEFQQRGPPHAHMVLSLKRHIRNAEDIDRVCQAVIPELDGTKETEELRKLVEHFMIHRPCENDPDAYCREHLAPNKKQCRKNFPKPFNDTTRFGDKNYPDLRRPDNGEVSTENGNADNRYVVPYNKQLLTFFKSHINIEVVSNLSIVKYIFKYVFKGYDRVLVEAITSLSAPETAAMTIEGHMIYPKSLTIPPGAKKQREMQAVKMLKKNNVNLTDSQGKKVLVYDEYAMIEDQRAITSCEAAWDFQAFSRHAQSHTVVDLFTHVEDEEPIFYQRENQEAKEKEVEQNKEIRTRFKEWFKLNERDEDARKLTYDQLPTKYVFENKKWRKRKNNRVNLLGRIKSVNPINKEGFATRLLASAQRGPRSFDELRTVNGVVHTSSVSAATALGLMNNKEEWDKCLEEACAEKVPLTLRRLFATILIYNIVENARELWDKYKEQFFERKMSWSEEKKEAHALYHIRSLLRAHGLELKKCYLPEINEEYLPRNKDELDDDSGYVSIPVRDAEKEFEKLSEMFNEDQKHIYEEIIEAIENGDHTKAFFIQGSGGTGKTHLLRALYFYLTTKSHMVACTAHTGIAARLLPAGSTAHRLFHIPLAVEDGMFCRINQELEEAKRLKNINVVIWDEATMTDKRILRCVHKLLTDIHYQHEGELFGGVTFIFGGDWKQTLPIVREARGAAAVNYTMRGSRLWDEIEVFTLNENMRARFDPPFAKWLLDLGHGRCNVNPEAREEDQLVKLEFGTLVESEAALITAVFGDLSAPPNTNRKCFESSSILSVDNRTTFEINEKALKRMPGEMRTFFAIDEHDPDGDFSYLDPEIYHMETPSGMPPFELNVKVGAPAILLKNINTSLGLVNGTRLIIEEIKDHVIWVSPVNPAKNCPTRVALSKTLFAPINVLRREGCFMRTQFPIRLAFSLTCNKSQGQTLDRVGLLLRTPCFSHGQLYVACSRVRRAADLFIYNAQGSQRRQQKIKEKEQRKQKNALLKEKAKIKRQQLQKRKEQVRRRKQRTSKIDEDVERMEIDHEESQDMETSQDDEISASDESTEEDLRLYTNNVVYRNALNGC